ncbi:apurinic/apyrimidinic endonuclease family protein [Haploplasma axanthum]|uniref:Uncharacterized protein n=1 Tax=Haploplasma axanthum TaxID=29552 RepID=A0A449BFN5_HAPAX|nr:TIM barrel protein [Haploplasma axanthum]VEU81225.1 Uncharacterised protein [Haploplasma axanthum]
MRIIGYCDFDGTTIKEQIETANKLHVDHLIFRTYEDKNISILEDSEIKEISRELKLSKKDIMIIDPKIESYDLYDVDAYEKVLFEYEQAINQANKLKVNYILYRLPNFKNVLDEFDSVEKQLTPIIDLAKKSAKTLLIYPEKEKTNVLVYILKKYRKKDLSLIFNPAQTIKNGESPTTAYRLLKEYFQFFIAADTDSKSNPELLGYGKVKIIDLFKRMNRDNYKGYIVLDDSFPLFLDMQTTKKVPWFKKLFKSKNNSDNYLRGYSLRIFPNEPERIVDIFDIYENQVKALKIVFNLRD